MRKLLTIALSLIAVFVMSLTVSAQDVTQTGEGTQTIDITAQSKGTIIENDFISVDISYGAMEFTYEYSGTKDWDPSTHSYTDNSNKEWKVKGNNIKLVNHSNVDVDVELSFAKATGVNVTGSFDVTKKTLTRGLEGQYDNAPSLEAFLTLSGSLDQGQSATKVGTISIVFKKTK